MKVMIDLLELRRALRAKCEEIIDDNDIAEMFYDRLIKIEDDSSFEDVTETQTPQPEIIRCKDCKYWGTNDCSMYNRYGEDEPTHDEWFCAIGERR